MPGWDNHTYLWMMLISNLVAILQLVAAFKWPRVARISFVLLFSWACWMNWTTAIQSPEAYLEYAPLALFNWTESFIRGWFAKHIFGIVSFIATCQGLIAIALLFRGRIFRLGCLAGIIFLISIFPLGVGSAFPCTIVMAAALLVLCRKYNRQTEFSRATSSPIDI